MGEIGRRFRHIPRGCALYVAELGEGVVKVGFSNYPARRLQKLQYALLRDSGAAIARYFVSDALASEREAREAEGRAISRFRLVGQQLPRRIEYFTGISFDAATEIVRGVVAKAA